MLGTLHARAADAAGPPTLPNAVGSDLAATPVTPVASVATVQRPPIQRPTGLPVSATPVAAQPTVASPSEPAPTSVAAPVAPPDPAPVGPMPAPVRPEPDSDPALDPVDAASPSTPRHHAGGLAASAEPKSREHALPHKGAVADFRLGTLGCLRGVCNGGHGGKPGVRLDGFIGGNIRGFVELGLAGGWGTISPHVDNGTNVLSMYGLDPYALQASLLGAASALAPIDFGALVVTGNTQVRSMQVGPVARVHFVPRGRVLAFVGAGAQYNLFRGRYDTSLGAVKLDFHGLAVPIEAALGVHVHKHIAIMAQFDYLWTWYGLAVLDSPQQRMALPVAALQTAAQQQGADLRGELPQFWSLGVGLRGRM